MSYFNKPAPFVLVASDHGSLIVNFMDVNTHPDVGTYGVGYQILTTGSYDHEDIELITKLLILRKQLYPGDLVVVDCGANIGVLTVEFAKFLTGHGFVFAIEAQERIFYALAGNIAINNLMNAKAIHGAISNHVGTMKIPKVNYNVASSFGSLELIPHPKLPEDIGQELNYEPDQMADVNTYTIDSFNLDRIDFIKLDIEGMEFMALQGAVETLKKHKPSLWIEKFKTDEEAMRKLLTELDYKLFDAGFMNVLAVHKNDMCLDHISMEKPK